MSTCRAFFPDTDTPRGEADFIRNNEDLLRRNLVEIRHRGNAVSGEIHIGKGFQDQYVFRSNSRFRKSAVKFRAFQPLPSQGIQ